MGRDDSGSEKIFSDPRLRQYAKALCKRSPWELDDLLAETITRVLTQERSGKKAFGDPIAHACGVMKQIFRERDGVTLQRRRIKKHECPLGSEVSDDKSKRERDATEREFQQKIQLIEDPLISKVIDVLMDSTLNLTSAGQLRSAFNVDLKVARKLIKKARQELIRIGVCT